MVNNDSNILYLKINKGLCSGQEKYLSMEENPDILVVAESDW